MRRRWTARRGRFAQWGRRPVSEVATLAVRLGAALEAAGLRLVTAESCTGGGVAEAVTAVPGSSAWFDRGVVTYSNEAKQEMLGVPASLIETHGAVSEPVVEAMAHGARGEHAGRAVIAVSGIAGPLGGSAAKPVGTVCLAFAVARGAPRTRTVHFDGDRTGVRRQAVCAAISDLVAALESRRASGRATEREARTG